MKVGKIAISILFLSAAFAAPASANYFSNPVRNTQLNVGSAPNPTVRDIRENRMPVAVSSQSASAAGSTWSSWFSRLSFW